MEPILPLQPVPAATLQVTPDTDAVNCCVPPTGMEAELGETEGGGTTVTVALASAEVSA
jgi:hypothetical protein